MNSVKPTCIVTCFLITSALITIGHSAETSDSTDFVTEYITKQIETHTQLHTELRQDGHKTAIRQCLIELNYWRRIQGCDARVQETAVAREVLGSLSRLEREITELEAAPQPIPAGAIEDRREYLQDLQEFIERAAATEDLQ